MYEEQSTDNANLKETTMLPYFLKSPKLVSIFEDLFEIGSKKRTKDIGNILYAYTLYQLHRELVIRDLSVIHDMLLFDQLIDAITARAFKYFIYFLVYLSLCISNNLTKFTLIFVLHIRYECIVVDFKRLWLVSPNEQSNQ